MVRMGSIFSALVLFTFLLAPFSLAEEQPFEYSDIENILESHSIKDVENKASKDPKYAYVAAIAYLNGLEVEGDKINIEKEKGICYLKKSADSGFAAASYSLGGAYRNGYGVKKNVDKWIFYTKKAAEAGYPSAQKTLGKAYLDKSNGLYNEKQAAYWYEKSASHGDEASIITVGDMYSNGWGVKKNMEKAFYWYKKGVQQDSIMAQKEIAALYSSGEGTEKDLVMAYMMYDLAGTSGIGGKKKVAQEMTEDQIKEAIAKSRRWQEEHKAFRPSYSGLEYQSDDSYR